MRRTPSLASVVKFSVLSPKLSTETALSTGLDRVGTLGKPAGIRWLADAKGTTMPDLPSPSRSAAQEAAFAAAYPELADMSSAQIREIRAYAHGAVTARAKALRREQAIRDFLAEHQAPLPGI